MIPLYSFAYSWHPWARNTTTSYACKQYCVCCCWAERVLVLNRILNYLTQALQSSGVDLSQACISVQINAGKPANSRPNAVAFNSKVCIQLKALSYHPWCYCYYENDSQMNPMEIFVVLMPFFSNGPDMTLVVVILFIFIVPFSPDTDFCLSSA